MSAATTSGSPHPSFKAPQMQGKVALVTGGSEKQTPSSHVNQHLSKLHHQAEVLVVLFLSTLLPVALP